MIKKLFVAVLIIAIYPAAVFSQALTQTVRGTIIDADSKMPLVGAQIIILDSTPLKGTTSNRDGEFRLENIPIGRVALRITYLGYESQIIPNIMVNSGKEVVLYLDMRESVVMMDELTVRPDLQRGEALNDMAIVSSRSISAEETNRYAGGFNDPARILSNFAGVNNPQNGNSDIIVRGNSPKYVQWRLEGVPITNPNHFGDQIGTGGLTTLNNNLLATSDFYAGAFSSEYGNALSGIYDVILRPGNNEKFESVFGFGLLGTDLTLEGPFKKGYGGSYLVNYRYSTITLIDEIGLVPDLGGIPKFQDAAFKVTLPTRNMGTFSLFGLSGMSGVSFEDVTPDIWVTPGERGMSPNIREDFDKQAHLLNTGMKHILPLQSNSYIQTTLTYSNEGVRDRVFEVLLDDDEEAAELNFSSRIMKSTYRASFTYNNKLNARNNVLAGTQYALYNYDYNQSQLREGSNARFSLTDFRENVNTINNFVSWQYRMNERLTVVSGLHNVNVLLNNKSTLEPRIAVNWMVSPSGSVQVGYSMHSTMESIHHYFARVEQEDGSVIETNKDLDLLKAHHYVLGYEQRFGRNFMGKIEFYYQDLYNLPVENDESSFYATINEDLDFRYVDLVNEGTGKNYGVELTLERFFTDNYYFLINGSLFSSLYTPLDGIERNTPNNGRYMINILVGREFVNIGRNRNQTLGVNARIFFGGGRKIIPLLRDMDGNLAIDTENNRFWDYERAYEHALDDVFTLTISTSYKWNKPRATHELYLNLDNVTNHVGRLSEFYDASQPGSIGYINQFGFFPNLMYKVYF